jgi:uncharacterized membrane protein YhaH (DUF805 family)
MSATVTIWDHFKRLFDFSGREDRASFWPYAAVAFIIIMIVGMTVFVPMTGRSMYAMQQFAAQHPDQATVTSGPGHYSISVQGNHPEFMPTGSVALYLAVTFGLSILLYAAAVVRRLHDRGKSGFWGLMPLPFIIYSSVQMPRMFATVGAANQPDMTLFFSIFFSNLLYIVTLIWLIVLLASPSDPAPNRYSMGV